MNVRTAVVVSVHCACLRLWMCCVRVQGMDAALRVLRSIPVKRKESLPKLYPSANPQALE